MADVERDAISGQHTTGHEWDGIKELNTPLPKWWLYTFYATILFSVVYWVLYPAWPMLSSYTEGVLGYSSRATHDADLAAQAQSRAAWSDKFGQMSVDEIGSDTQLLNYAMAGGKSIFAENCAPCHGSGGAGAPNYPILADDDWLWGGSREAIYQTVRYGVRSGHDEARDSVMPNFGTDELLESSQIADVVQYVRSLSGADHDAAAAGRGATVFADECAACHGEDGKGLPELGGPNLTDGIWLYDSGIDGVPGQVNQPKHGVMPAWVDRLSDVAIKQVSLYVHSLGGGE